MANTLRVGVSLQSIAQLIYAKRYGVPQGRQQRPSRDDALAAPSWPRGLPPSAPTNLTAGDLREAALSFSDATGNLNRTFLAVAALPGRSEVDTRKLGHWLGRHRGRIIDGIKIHGEQDKRSKQMVWWLAEVLPTKAL